MKHVTTIIIGAGQSGLAMSHELSRLSIDHVILERGQVANSWRTERWDSLRLLSPNWANGLPGIGYDGGDPNGFMAVPELIRNFDSCATRINAPVETETSVLSVTRDQSGYTVQTDQLTLTCDTVVMATGACAKPSVPDFAEEAPSETRHLTPHSYKRPSDLPSGKVLVVGASASGLQLAREIQMSGRQVILAVGNHLRLPRNYRGVDLYAWLEKLGLTSISYTDVDDIERVRRTPSLSLVADETLDLNVLQDIGVEITGRLCAFRDGEAYFSGGLANMCAAADLKMNRLLSEIDRFVAKRALHPGLPDPIRHLPTAIPKNPRLKMNLQSEDIGAILWATGYKADFSWLDLPVFDRKGRLNHDGGVVAPGLYAMGLPYLRQRKSTFINGASSDAVALAAHLNAGLARRSAA